MDIHCDMPHMLYPSLQDFITRLYNSNMCLNQDKLGLNFCLNPSASILLDVTIQCLCSIFTRTSNRSHFEPIFYVNFCSEIFSRTVRYGQT